MKIINTDNTSKQLYYNNQGQLIRKIDEEGFETELEYNMAGLLISVKSSDGNNIKYEYDDKRFLISVRGSFGSMEFDRSNMGLVNKVTYSGEQSISYEYDKYGRTTAIVYPEGKRVEYKYDSCGRLSETSCDAVSSKLAYDGLGRLACRSYGDGSKIMYEYNDIGSPIRLLYVGVGKTYIEYTYTYDAVGNKLSKIVKSEDKEKTYRYSYDEVGRLTGVSLDGENLREYSYDAFGNRTQRREYAKEGKITTTYTYSAGKLTDEFIMEKNSHTQYEYDKRGNLVKEICNGETRAEYFYNGLGQLIEVISGEDKVTYEYDGLGHRVGKTETKNNVTSTKKYVLDIRKPVDNILRQETDGKQRDFLWDIQLISEMEDGDDINVICDELGSVVFEGDKYFEYEEFGEPLGNTPEIFGFAGLMVDEVSKNYLSATRMYDEKLGRFLGKDKIKGSIYYGFTQNEYTYCYNSPLIFVDNTGNSPIVDFLKKVVLPNGWNLFDGIKWAVSEVFNNGFRYWDEHIPSGLQREIAGDAYNVINFGRTFMETDVLPESLAPFNIDISDFSNAFAASPISTPIFDLVDFHKDRNGIFHVARECWQSAVGYNDFYDFVFGAYTSMNKAKFKFGVGENTFTLWMWKGDYFNLGAGGEIGIYKGDDRHVDCYTQSKLKMNLDVRLKDGTQVIDWDANDLRQWWITGFNPARKFQDMEAEDLILTGMVDFDEERAMWKEFVDTAEFNDPNEDKIKDNWCIDFVHRSATMKWEKGNRN